MIIFRKVALSWTTFFWKMHNLIIFRRAAIALTTFFWKMHHVGV